MLICLWAAGTLPVHLRVMASLALLALMLPPWRRVLCGQGPRAVRHLRWEPDGSWVLTLAGGVVERGCRLESTSATAGPWIWLTLRGRVLHHVVLDRRSQGAAAFAALRRRLLAQRRSAPRATGRPQGRARTGIR